MGQLSLYWSKSREPLWYGVSFGILWNILFPLALSIKIHENWEPKMMGWDLHLLTTKLKVKLLQFYTQQTAIIKAGNKRLKNGTLPHSKKYYFKVRHGLTERRKECISIKEILKERIQIWALVLFQDFFNLYFLFSIPKDITSL